MGVILGYEEFKILPPHIKAQLCDHAYYNSTIPCRHRIDYCHGRTRWTNKRDTPDDEWCSHWRDIDPFVLFMILRKEKRNAQCNKNRM